MTTIPINFTRGELLALLDAIEVSFDEGQGGIELEAAKLAIAKALEQAK